MRSRILPLVLVTAFAFTMALAGCFGDRDRPDSNGVSESVAGAPDDRVFTSNCNGGGLETCGTDECIENYLNAYDTGYLTITGSATHVLDGYFLINCDATSQASSMKIAGANGSQRPTLEQGVTSDHLDTNHAMFMHFAENWTPKPTTLENLIVSTSSEMSGSDRPAIQFESAHTKLVNVKFTTSSATTTHFQAPRYIAIDRIETTAGHEFVIGRSDWADGEVGQWGPDAASLYDDQSYIKNSVLSGPFEFDMKLFVDGPAKTLYIEDNDLVANLTLALDKQGYTADVKVELTNNVFADAPGAKVKIVGDYVVEASGNTTFQGPCMSDALMDFDLSQSNLPADEALVLASWVYDGVTYYAVDDLVISNVTRTWSASTCMMDVTWTTNVPATSNVEYSAQGDCSGGVTISNSTLTTNHAISFSPTGFTNRQRVYIRVWSQTESGCLTQSSCAFVTKGYCF